MGKYDVLKEACFQANIQLPKLGLVLFTFGNVSAADQREGVFAIKPSGVPYDQLRPSDMVVVDLDGEVVEGKLNPSTDTKTHAVLYRHWKVLGGIAHTHSTYAVAWAQAQKDIPVFGTTHADHCSRDIPCVPLMAEDLIQADYERETGNQIVKYFLESGMDPADIEMTLVANHGPFTWSKNPEKAVYNSAVLEEIARIAYLTLSINPSAPLLPKSLIDKHYNRKHGRDAYYGQKGL